MLKFLRRVVVWSLVAAMMLTALLVFQLKRFQYGAIELESGPSTFLIRSGSNIKSISQDLARAKIINDPWLFILLAKVRGLETRVRAGEYQIETGITADELLEKLIEGNSIQYQLTVIEGWTFRQMLTAIAENPIVENTLQGKTDEDIMALLDLPGQHPEGLFFPDTYRFPKGTTDLSFLKRAYQVMDRHLQREWSQRAPDLPLKSAYEALILASIIEKETGAGFERPLISAVFIERLRRNMRLQTDPTIIYGLGDSYDGNIRSRDLKKNTPYNTYLHGGLTPTPIALPGLASIHAALHPAPGNALYFVSRGDGTHQFSATLEEHNAAVRRYQLNQRN